MYPSLNSRPKNSLEVGRVEGSVNENASHSFGDLRSILFTSSSKLVRNLNPKTFAFQQGALRPSGAGFQVVRVAQQVLNCLLFIEFSAVAVGCNSGYTPIRHLSDLP